MKRRTFIAGLGGAAAWPLVARAQQPVMPVVGYLYVGSPEPGEPTLVAFRKGLSETGYVEGRNVRIEYRWADGQYDRLPMLAADLVRRQVAVIAAVSTSGPGLAAKAATSTIPIVFQTGGDPVQDGLVASLNQVGGNITGISSMNAELTAKRLGLLHELIPGAARFAVLVNPNSTFAQSIISSVQAAASGVGRPIEVLTASTNREIDTAFASLVQKRVDAVLVSPDGLFYDRRVQLATLATHHKMPAIYAHREIAAAGGLMSYGADVADSYRQVGVYTGTILKGAKPADLPVVQSTKFEFVINLQAARLLGIDVPPTLLATADEVIE